MIESWQCCSVGFIYPHCDSPFVNHTVYFSKQLLKDVEKEMGRMAGNNKKRRRREEAIREKLRNKSFEFQRRIYCKSRTATFAL